VAEVGGTVVVGMKEVVVMKEAEAVVMKEVVVMREAEAVVMKEVVVMREAEAEEVAEVTAAEAVEGWAAARGVGATTRNEWRMGVLCSLYLNVCHGLWVIIFQSLFRKFETMAIVRVQGFKGT